MIRRDNYFLLTQIDNVLDIKYEGLMFFVDIKVDYCNSPTDFNEKVILPKYIAVLNEDKLDIIIINKLIPFNRKYMQLECVSNHYIELNDIGKEQYNLYCMMYNDGDKDDKQIDINEFIEKYTY